MNDEPVYAFLRYNKKKISERKLSMMVEVFRCMLGSFPSSEKETFALHDGCRWVESCFPETWQKNDEHSGLCWLEVKRPSTKDEDKGGLQTSSWLLKDDRMIQDKNGELYLLMLEDPQFADSVYADIWCKRIE